VSASADTATASDQAFLDLIESENESMRELGLLPQFEAAPVDTSAVVDDPAFLEMIAQESFGLGLSEYKLQPAPGSRAAGNVGAPVDASRSIDDIEREIYFTAGTQYDTLADLFSAVYGSFAGKAGSEDLTREIK
jgi:hypothetical protein